MAHVLCGLRAHRKCLDWGVESHERTSSGRWGGDMISFSCYGGHSAAWKIASLETEVEAGRCCWKSCGQADEGGQEAGGGFSWCPRTI